MGSEWRLMNFADAVEINPQVKLQRGKIYPFVSMEAVSPDHHWTSGAEFREYKGGGARFQTGDTLMARITPSLEHGKITRYDGRDNHSVGFGSTEFIVIREKRAITDRNFVYYLVKSPLVHLYAISQMTGTSGRQRVPTDALKHLNVPIPPLPEQRAIAHILGALDDQIETLRRMNETLEGIARALFKAWFVDFEPVRAKMSGRWQRGQSLPGLPADLYDLFPDTLVPSELGEIPDDWKVGAIKECCIKIYNGGTPRREEPSYWFPATIPWLTSKEVRQCLIVETENFISSEGLAHSSAKWLPTFSTVVALYGATAGQVAFLGIPTTTNQAVCGLVPKPSFRFYNYFVLSLSSKKLANSARGSAQQNISKSIVESTLTLIPPIALVERFDQLCQPIFDKWIANLRQSRTLAALRDALLPELISGRLRLADAERFLQARGL